MERSPYDTGRIVTGGVPEPKVLLLEVHADRAAAIERSLTTSTAEQLSIERVEGLEATLGRLASGAFDVLLTGDYSGDTVASDALAALAAAAPDTLILPLSPGCDLIVVTDGST